MAYSKKIEEALKAKKIAVGDRVRVSKKDLVLEGILMPRIEAGDENALVVKLDSGYNTGVSFDAGTEVSRSGSSKARLEKVPKIKAVRSGHLPSVSIIATGGTISTRVDYKTGGVKMVLKPEEILAVMPEAAGLANYALLSPFTIASEDMTFREWISLARHTAKELNSGAEGVVVMHGTDTLGFTSAALSFMLRDLTKPVAVVGAQRSPDRGSFDGAMNLVCGTRYALSRFAEVAVVMHASASDDYCFAHYGTKCRKMHSSRRDAFRSVNAAPLAKIFPDGKIEALNGFNERKKGGAVLDAVFEEKTALVKFYPGFNPEMLEHLIDKKYAGIVLEGTGLGHAAVAPLEKKFSLLRALERAREEKIFVAMTTQCLFGSVNPFVYKNLREVAARGVFYCKDMLPETAFVKLGWVLGHSREPEAVKKMMETNYAREYNARLTENDFI